MSLLWKIILLPIAAVFAWDGFIVIAANQPTPWLWVVRRPHYEVTFSVQLPDGIRKARGVVEAVYYADPLWDQTIPPLPVIGMGQIVGRKLSGEAVTMCLRDGKAISMLLDSQISRKSIVGTGWYFDYKYDLFSLANKLLTQEHIGEFQQILTPIRPGEFKPELHTEQEFVPYITAFSADSVSGVYKLAEDQIPTMLFFENTSDVNSARLFDAKSAEKWLGANAKFLGATLSVTSAPVQSDTHKCLPWLNNCEFWTNSDWAMFKNNSLRPREDGPLAIEANDPMAGINLCHDLLYRSHV